MKALLYIGSVVLLPLALVMADFAVGGFQSRKALAHVTEEDFLQAFEKRAKPGMTRSEVERLVSGFREIEEGERDENGHEAVVYRYWFGFLPLYPPYEFKLIGELVVTYDRSGHVVDAFHAYN